MLPVTKCTPKRHPNCLRGFTIIEVTLALIIFLMMVLMFAAVFPVAIRGSLFSNYYSEATILAQHKVDQLRYVGFSKMQDSAQLGTLEIADSGTPSSAPPYTVSFTTVDSLASSSTIKGLFPPGSTGTIKVIDYSTVPGLVNPPPAGQVDQVTVTVNWKGFGTVPSSYTISGLIVQMPHQ